MTKRKFSEVSVCEWGTEEVSEWLLECEVLPSDTRPAVAAQAQTHEVDGEVLTSLTEAELEAVLGVDKFGTRRKLHHRIQALKGGGPTALPAKPVVYIPVAVSATPPPALPALAAPPPAGGRTTPPLLQASLAAMRKEVANRQAGTHAFTMSNQSNHHPSAAAVAGPSAAAAAAAPSESLSLAFQAAHTPRLALDSKLVDAQLNSEATCVVSLSWSARKMLELLRSEQHWAPPALRDARLAELSKLSQKCVLPGMSVVVVGTTGAGKSTLLNALLGEKDILPTNGMRACTAALIELSYNSIDQGERYLAEVEFISKEEWAQEEEALFEDLTQQDGRAILGVSDPNAHNYNSFCRMYSVYGESYTKSRYPDPTGQKGPDGRVRYVNMTVPELRAKLRGERRITGALGTTRCFGHEEARDFKRMVEKYVDSSNDADSTAFWPLVRRVRMRGRWALLKSGCTLVDAPGVGDDNTARDGIVKTYIKEADAIWIVSNIKRAVNDKAAKNMLGESFRRQLLMDGQYGQLLFLATQSDVIVRSEIAKSLGLSSAAPLPTIAAARNEYTRKRIQKDFIDGLVEMSEASGEEVEREALEKRFSLPVFALSSTDFQKLAGIRTQDGPPNVWTDIEATEIPALRRFVHEATLRRRAVTISRQVEALCQFGKGMEAHLADDGTADSAQRTAIQAAFASEAQTLQQGLKIPLKVFANSLTSGINTSVGPQLKSGASDATKECSGTARGWRTGGYHWASYKATCRRDGVWRIDFNGTLAEPVYRAVSTHWERTFVSALKKDLDTLTRLAVKQLQSFHDLLALALAAAGVPAARAAALRGSHEAAGAAAVRAAADKAQTHASAKQKEASRLVTPTVQEQMKPAYAAANADSGTGSHARRCALLEGHVDSHRDKMFNQAIEPVLEGLDTLRDELAQMLSQGIDGARASLALQYSPLWEVPGAAGKEARGRLKAPFNVAALEAYGARKKLLEAAAARAAAALSGEPDGMADAEVRTEVEDDDDDIVDVTAQETARRLVQQAKERVDLTIDSDDEGGLASFLTHRAKPPVKEEK